ncbi:dihydroorotase [Clostridium acetobutylicum]|uniref:Dihydroorotase n=1 Tax=Clostridium acetobutylicum (strain ATCC 824 / DSM 792 / JCM 1419 / IAM 19013 / LMG 5710 / NBRC 13948 / NRRL B-527 / VKM B-1787 / 2291 / W) TaxID=272562 RepID=PYRC_CLOAB|nr:MULTISPECIES: dihydroorotase [Clostridium]Q97LN7.1 RecName: Full=Dihydroorotase; Short=DHOase [Clostridium acetobutylicum ATCC 824]AAK78499.1 Dihydroorotase [Clostridium acetobutylicum ATCC 824]ADZ19569.1 dihydroorotase [Clostridium acetobutylicum EA 2018]AEI34289.1 dihydroorotase [Clostridium acetobutylicum DSM 1731]AWV80220.1 dihydroorotase [Clostridium acetobutylicum]MBC2392402.1 dihydroorotase [Clostridium acetobutylicum]
MIIIKNGYVIDPLTKREGKFDILIDGENVVRISQDIGIDDDIEVIDAEDCIVSPGFIDIHSHFRDPGFTEKEDIITGARAAARGGYTTVICMANTNPVVDNVETLRYIVDKAKTAKIEVLQVGTITKGMQGVELVDMEALKEAGAVGFSDDGKPIMDSRLVLEAMQKARELDVPLSFHEEDPKLVYESGINGGKVAEKLNMMGALEEAETVLTARDAALAVSSGAKTNIQHISSKISLGIIKLAKEMGANIIAEATPQHFSITEEEILNCGTNAKVNPPLRREDDRKAIVAALKDDTIQVIATDHAPHTKDEKAREFKEAPSGMIGLETALSLAVTNLVKTGDLTYRDMISKLTINPARFYNLDRGYIKEGHRADIVIFDPDEKYTVKEEEFQSKASNSPFIGKELFGKVKTTIYNGKIVYEDK